MGHLRLNGLEKNGNLLKTLRRNALFQGGSCLTFQFKRFNLEYDMYRHAAGKLYESKIKDCYSKANRLVERTRTEMALVQADDGRKKFIDGDISFKVPLLLVFL